MKKLLFISHRMPYPPDKGERVRAFHEIKELSKKFEVTVLGLCHNTADFASADGLAKFCHKVVSIPAGGMAGLARGAINRLKGKSVTEVFFISSKAIHAVRALGKFDVGVGYSSSVLELLCQADVSRRILDIVDVDSVKWSQYAQSHKFLKRWLYAGEARAVATLEHRAIELCDNIFVVSESEAALLGDMKHQVLSVANGVECDYFSPDMVDPVDFGPNAMVFTGSMDYKPNIEGVVWFANNVFKTLKEKLPDATFTIVGRNPARAVRALEKYDGVNVTGTVEDVRPYLKGASVAVCPLQIGRGIQNKLLEAMAMGKAAVVSQCAVDGIGAKDGQELLLADSAGEWIENLLYLATNKEVRAGLGDKARCFVLSEFSWQARLEPFVNACENHG